MAGLIWANHQARKTDISSIISRMALPADIPERLKLAGRSQADLARHLGLDPSSLTKTIRGTRQLKADELIEMETFFSGMAEEGARFVSARRAPRAKVPVYGYAAAGGEERIAVNEGRVIDWIDPPPFWSGAGELLAVKVIGVSMEPRLFQGEMVIAQRNLSPTREQDCLVELCDGSGLIKTYVGQRDPSIVCRQYNPAKELQIAKAEVRSLHAIIWRR